MKIIVAPDSFKDCLSAMEVANNVEIGIRSIIPTARIVKIPISDGGEGLLEALVKPLGGTISTTHVNDPLGKIIKANYGLIDNGLTAIIEIAKASGLELLKKKDRNPLLTSTYGTGQLIIKALNSGCTKIIVGLGGSATNDGGTGMIKALGGKFLNKDGLEIKEGGGYLMNLDRIDISDIDKRIYTCEILGACDVSNPLTGADGASFVFGKQKGGTKHDLKVLDANLGHLTKIVTSQLKKNNDNIPGAGAAGGMGYGLLTFLNAKLVRGIDLITSELQLENAIMDADMVVTGEGKIDAQTLFGKTITGVAKIAKRHGVPVVAIGGKIGEGIEEIYKIGISSVHQISDDTLDLEISIRDADILIQACIGNVMKTILRNL